jgi:hypothetical protein
MEATLALVAFGIIPLAFLLVAAGTFAGRWRR